jgi:hypothetical protein
MAGVILVVALRSVYSEFTGAALHNEVESIIKDPLKKMRKGKN